MMLVVLSIVLQLAALAIQGVQCWLDAHRHGPCRGCSGCTGCSGPARRAADQRARAPGAAPAALSCRTGPHVRPGWDSVIYLR